MQQDERKHVAETGRKIFDEVTASFEMIDLNEKEVIRTEERLKVSFQHVERMYARKPGVIPKMWTPEEDQILKEAVERHGEKNWREIAEEVPDRNHLQCLQRWKKALKPGLVKGHWSKEEDDYLIQLMQEYEHDKWNWAKISEKIPGRNAKQCRERWFLNLDPSINRGPWTDEEDERLLKLHRDLAGRWSLIAKEMAGRTENSVKTRFHSLQRKEVKDRGWIQEEDEIFIRGLLTYGRNYPLCARLLPGRSRGQLKKRFPTLLLMRPELHQQVKEVEERIVNGNKPTPIHEMLKMLQEERKMKKAKQAGDNNKSITFTESLHNAQIHPENVSNSQAKLKRTKKEPVKSLGRFGSSWMDGILEEIAEPLSVANSKKINRTSSSNTLTDLLMPDDQAFSFYESDTESLKSNGASASARAQSQKQNQLMALDKVLSNMDDLGGEMPGSNEGAFQNEGVYSNAAYGYEDSERVVYEGRERRDSSGWERFLEEEIFQQKGGYSSHEVSFAASREPMRSLNRNFSANSWNSQSSLHNMSHLHMPVV